MSPTQINDKEITDEETEWHQERLNRFEKMLKSKTIKESRAKKELEEIQTNFLEVFRKLYKTSKHFKNAIDNLSPGTHPFELESVEDFQKDGISLHELHNILFEWERKNLFCKRGSPSFLKTFDMLVKLSKKMNSEYETDITMIKLKNGINSERLPIYFTQTRNNPIVSQYIVKGRTVKQIDVNSKKGSTQTIKQFNRPPDQILIRDLSSPSLKSRNVLIDGFAGMSTLTPTAIGYINPNGNSKLLISVPEYLDVTTFFKEYGKMLSRIHRNFYGKTYRRPKEMSRQLTLMEEIWKEKCEGKKMSANKQANILSKELMEKHDINLEPITITRWYLPHIRKKTRQKIANN
jgi:hypothetical protein